MKKFIKSICLSLSLLLLVSLFGVVSASADGEEYSFYFLPPKDTEYLFKLCVKIDTGETNYIDLEKTNDTVDGISVYSVSFQSVYDCADELYFFDSKTNDTYDISVKNFAALINKIIMPNGDIEDYVPDSVQAETESTPQISTSGSTDSTEPTFSSEPTSSTPTVTKSNDNLILNVKKLSYKVTYGKTKPFIINAATNKKSDVVTFQPKNKKIVSVDKKGKVTVKRCGKAKIKITAKRSSKTVSKNVSVIVKPGKVTFTKKIEYDKKLYRKVVNFVFKKSTRKMKCDKYQIQISSDKKFKENNRGENTYSGNVKKITLKPPAGKRFYARIRAYKKITGKKKTDYGEWTKPAVKYWI